jgi:hypothetical protein
MGEKEREATEERGDCVSRVALARWGWWGMGSRWQCPYFNAADTPHNGSVEAKGNTSINFGCGS